MFRTTEINTIEELLAEVESSNLSYDSQKIRAAYDWAAEKHQDQKRKSGQPYIIHPLTVAAYCVRLNLDSTSVIAALLHDTVEDTNGNLDEIDSLFGTEVAFIVDGLTDLKEYTAKFDSHDETQENFRRLMLKATEDIRVIIIRLADKMHNIQTAHFLSPERRYNFAKKIKLIYGPISEYIGLGYFHSVFMEESFKILEPEKYKLIETELATIKQRSTDLLADLNDELTELFQSYGLKVDISTRTKNTQSIWMKIKRKVLRDGEELQPHHIHSLQDVLGIRIITEDIEDAYIALGLVQSGFEQLPDSFDDYIVNPKPNGYQSIHLVIDHKGQQFEIQIRTQEMHNTNEFGAASHIAYKLQGGSDKEDRSFTWTKDLWRWRDNQDGKSKYKIKAFASSIFVFTPKGRVIQLDKGASPIDFAFKVHTDLGFRYIGAKVNGKMVSMSHQLETGDIVEILTGSKENVNAGWLEFAKGHSSRYRIRKWVRTSQLLHNGRPKN